MPTIWAYLGRRAKSVRLFGKVADVGVLGELEAPNGSDIWVWWRVLELGVLGEWGHPMVLTFGSGGVYWDWVYWASGGTQWL